MTMRLSMSSLAGTARTRGGGRDLEAGLHVGHDARGRAAQLLDVVGGLGARRPARAGRPGRTGAVAGWARRDRRREPRAARRTVRPAAAGRAAGAAGRRRGRRGSGRGRGRPAGPPASASSPARRWSARGLVPSPRHRWSSRPRACSPRRSPTRRGRPRSCPGGTARTARPRATRWRRKRHGSSQDPPSGSRWDRPLPPRFVTASLLVHFARSVDDNTTAFALSARARRPPRGRSTGASPPRHTRVNGGQRAVPCASRWGCRDLCQVMVLHTRAPGVNALR